MTAVTCTTREPWNPSPTRSRAQVFRRRRLLAMLLVGLVCVMAARTGTALGSATGGAAESAPQSITYVVESGDTLWSIAAELDPKSDPRNVVDAIVDVRGNGPLQPGEKILWQP